MTPAQTLEHLIHTRRRMFVAFAAQYVGDAAEDVVQNALIRAWLYLPDAATMAKHRGLQNWLFRIVRNAVTDYSRRPHIRREVLELDAPREERSVTVPDPLAPDCAIEVIERDLEARVHAAIDAAMKPYMAQFMHAVADLPRGDDLARRFGVSEQNVRNLLCRGRTKMRDKARVTRETLTAN